MSLYNIIYYLLFLGIIGLIVGAILDHDQIFGVGLVLLVMGIVAGFFV